MHSHSQLLWQLLPILALSTIGANGQQPVTRSYCTTSLTNKSTSPVKTQTDYSTKTEKPTIYVTSTPSITTTPPPSTETSIVATMTTITVTASQITVGCPLSMAIRFESNFIQDTFTDTSTILTTSTIEAPTSTYTETVTESTETTVYSTSTVPTLPGFIPIQTSVNKAPPSKRDAALLSRNSGGLIARANAKRDSKNSGPGSKSEPQYPKKVSCSVQVTSYAPAKTSLKTAKTTKTIAAPALTYTVTETTTLEATSTFLPSPASSTVSTETTVTVEETFTPSTTVKTTTTTTNTINAPVETYYAQCADDNYIGTDGFFGQFVSGAQQRIDGITSRYGCCAACAQQTGCEYAAWMPNGFGCILVLNNQCSDQFFLSQTVNRYTASNGCVNAKVG
ncbi:hypothetical protein Q7P37_007372 [Cladosporium fusiforme]